LIYITSSIKAIHVSGLYSSNDLRKQPLEDFHATIKIICSMLFVLISRCYTGQSSKVDSFHLEFSKIRQLDQISHLIISNWLWSRWKNLTTSTKWFDKVSTYGL